jgi:hypothetical protein
MPERTSGSGADSRRLSESAAAIRPSGRLDWHPAVSVDGRRAEDLRLRRERRIDPISRISEILFGLIMALTFTGTLGATTAGREEIRTLLPGPSPAISPGAWSMPSCISWARFSSEAVMP